MKYFIKLFNGIKIFSNDAFEVSHKLRNNFYESKWNMKGNRHFSMLLWNLRGLRIRTLRALKFLRHLKRNKIHVDRPITLNSFDFRSFNWKQHLARKYRKEGLSTVRHSFMKKPKSSYKGKPIREINTCFQVFSFPMTKMNIEKLEQLYKYQNFLNKHLFQIPFSLTISILYCFNFKFEKINS